MSFALRDFQRIVVGVDGSPGSIAALRFAADQVRGGRAEVLAVHAWQSAVHTPETLAAEHEEALGRLNSFVAAAELPADVELRTETVAGPAGPALTRSADRQGDLLVIGAPAPRRRLLPRRSVSRFCLARAACPVLAVPADSRVSRAPEAVIDQHSPSVPSPRAAA
ncbi:universal stress protein [Streptomyces erythrochromogenes]|uniref:universal stress protein n=1 Tax=Streptomyces erythrochromogenes TaxID=285574 RepID=UPI00343E6ACD